MKIDWIIEPDDIAQVKEFFSRHRNSPFVRLRISRNLSPDKPAVSKSEFWRCHVGCLLTTQQRAGPGSPVARFMRKRPFLLSYRTCRNQTNAAKFALDVLRRFGGLRFSSKISGQVSENLGFLENDGGWKSTRKHIEAVRLSSSAKTERKAAEFLADNFTGIGPKQSRNLLQWLGLSRYETPIDSRITRWLNDFGFPFKLSASALADRNYYNLVSNGFQQLSYACGIKPCVLDAAIFASFDGDGWTVENSVG